LHPLNILDITAIFELFIKDKSIDVNDWQLENILSTLDKLGMFIFDKSIVCKDVKSENKFFKD
jgi:hypothetical protein